MMERKTNKIPLVRLSMEIKNKNPLTISSELNILQRGTVCALERPSFLKDKKRIFSANVNISSQTKSKINRTNSVPKKQDLNHTALSVKNEDKSKVSHLIKTKPNNVVKKENIFKNTWSIVLYKPSKNKDSIEKNDLHKVLIKGEFKFVKEYIKLDLRSQVFLNYKRFSFRGDLNKEGIFYVKFEFSDPDINFNFIQSLFFLLKKEITFLGDVLLCFNDKFKNEYFFVDGVIFSKTNINFETAFNYSLYSKKLPSKQNIVKYYFKFLEIKYFKLFLELEYDKLNINMELLQRIPKNNCIENIEITIPVWDASPSDQKLKNYIFNLIFECINHLPYLKSIRIEFCLSEDEKIKNELINVLPTNKKQMERILNYIDVYVRFSKYDDSKNFICKYSERWLNFNKLNWNVYPLLYCKYSQTSGIRKLHKFVINNICKYFINFSGKENKFDDKKIKVFDNLRPEIKVLKKTENKKKWL